MDHLTNSESDFAVPEWLGQVGHVLSSPGGGTRCFFPFAYTPPPAGLRPHAVTLSGGHVQLDLNGYAVAFGAVRCAIVFGRKRGSEVLLDPAVAVYDVVAPPVDSAGVASVAMDCSGGVGWRDLGVLLEYAEPAHAMADGNPARCALFAPCVARVRFVGSSSSTAAVAAGGIRPRVPGAVFVLGNSSIGPAEPRIEVTPATTLPAHLPLLPFGLSDH
jgi:hypothetical protein